MSFYSSDGFGSILFLMWNMRVGPGANLMEV